MIEMKKRILTGHRPTGPRHLGHLVGTLIPWAALQDTHDCFFLVADLHVLTTDYQHPQQISGNTLEVLLDWLAAGIDPKRSTLVLQSAVPEHAQLAILLGMLVSEARLRRNPTYKEQVKQLNLQPSLGLLGYPVLQAADILLYKGQVVPVGEDQLPHIELAREIARRFNQLYRPIFPEPEALLSPAPRLPGIDNRTMHSSYGNTILLRDTPEETTRKVMGMYTDPTRVHSTDPGHVEGNPLFTYLDLFDPQPEQVAELITRYQAGTVGDVAVKQHLAMVLNQFLAPLREKRVELAKDKDALLGMLHDESLYARKIARQTLEETMECMGLSLGVTRLPSIQ
ncbi:MAG: tryptophan--tRNA ligase [Bellilinea sp.]